MHRLIITGSHFGTLDTTDTNDTQLLVTCQIVAGNMNVWFKVKCIFINSVNVLDEHRQPLFRIFLNE